MAYDGHTPKRPRTDMMDRSEAGGNHYRGRQYHEEEPNHVLLVTVVNPSYPITVDVLHTICTPSGQVLRIVIFKKNGIQAMIEFDSIDSATRAKQSLHGADIYSGCCTLKIEFAKPNKLNVYKNDSESWDYTNPNLGKGVLPPQGPPPGPERPALLQEPRGYPPPQPPGPYRDAPPPVHQMGPPQGYPVPGHYDANAPVYGGPPPPSMGGQFGNSGDVYRPPMPPSLIPQRPEDHYQPRQDGYGGRDSYQNMGDGGYGGQSGASGPGASPQAGGMNLQGCVLMVYGLDSQKVNCDRLFNLFCLYGNVARVKFLKSKEGCAMVQMGESQSLDKCMANLNGAFFFGSKMSLGVSKQAFLQDVPQPYDLSDGSPSFKDYSSSRNNRYSNAEAARKNRIQPPSCMLHYFNAPPGITEDDINEIFDVAGVTLPISIKQFQAKSERSSSGLLEFGDVVIATEALVACNHNHVKNPNGKFPYTFKLCFSNANQGQRF